MEVNWNLIHLLFVILIVAVALLPGGLIIWISPKWSLGGKIIAGAFGGVVTGLLGYVVADRIDYYNNPERKRVEHDQVIKVYGYPNGQSGQQSDQQSDEQQDDL